MSDIAARAGTSTGVVSVTLNGARSKTLRVSDATRERVARAAEELGYRRDPSARALVTGRTQVIGLMLPHIESFAAADPFYSVVTAGVAAVASRRGYNLMLYTAVAEEEGQRAAENVDRRVDGLVLFSPPDDTPLFEECERQGIRVVSLLGRPEIAPHHVGSDDYEGGRLATEHLLELGHRRIAHLRGNPDFKTTGPRERAYLDALFAASVPADPALIVEGGFSRHKSRASTEALMALPASQRPTAIFASNDLSAHGAIDAIGAAGLRVPHDVSVVGYDDTWYAAVVHPALTTVAMDVDALGRRAAELLIDALELDESGADSREARPVLPVTLTVRDSTAPPPRSLEVPRSP